MANVGGSELVAPVAGATVAIAVNADVPTIVAKWTAGENETVNLSGTQRSGQLLTLMITNDAIVRTITLGSGFVGLGVIIGTALKTAVAHFQSDGTSFYEVSRTLGL